SVAYAETVRVWNVADRKQVRVLAKFSAVWPFVDVYYRNSFWRCRPAALAISPDGKQLACSANGPMIFLWDLHKLTLLRQWEAHSDAISTLAFANEGATLVSGGIDRDVRVWNVKAASEIRLGSHHAVVNTL